MLCPVAMTTVRATTDESAFKTAVSDHYPDPDLKKGGLAFRETQNPDFNAWLVDKS